MAKEERNKKRRNGPERALLTVLTSREGKGVLGRVLRGSVEQAGNLVNVAGGADNLGLDLSDLIGPLTDEDLYGLAEGAVSKTELLQWGAALGKDLITSPGEGLDPTLIENWINWSVVTGYQLTGYTDIRNELREIWRLPEKLRFVRGWRDFEHMTEAVKPLVEMGRRAALALPRLVNDLNGARDRYNARFGELAKAKQQVMGMLAKLDAARQLVTKETAEVNERMNTIADKLRNFSLNSASTEEMRDALVLLDEAGKLADQVSRAAGETMRIPPIAVMATEKAMNEIADLPTEQTVVSIYANRLTAALMIHEYAQVAMGRIVDGLVGLLYDYQQDQLGLLAGDLNTAVRARFIENMKNLSDKLPRVAGSYVGVGQLAAKPMEITSKFRDENGGE